MFIDFLLILECSVLMKFFLILFMLGGLLVLWVKIILILGYVLFDIVGLGGLVDVVGMGVNSSVYVVIIGVLMN